MKDTAGLSPKQLFGTLYKVLIDKESGPRAGWFLSILPREWLVKRLKLEA
jgi:lysyl-tRNA synthetase class I